MKRFPLCLTATLLIMTAGAQSPAGRKASTKRSPSATALTYNNALYGYSLILPVGFKAQNQDKAMEQERGGKLFLKEGQMIDVTAETKPEMTLTTQEALEMDAAFVYVDESAGEQLLLKELTDREMKATWIENSASAGYTAST